MKLSAPSKPLWQPSPSQIAATQMAHFMAHVGELTAQPIRDYAALHAWSLDAPELFWREVWITGELIGDMGSRVLIDADRMPGASWFPDATLNFAENLLRDCDNAEALVFWGEEQVKRRMSRTELRVEVARFAAALSAAGVEAGDRVAAYMPNLPETLVAMLAAASIGAIFTSASPDFGVQGLVDRFGQTAPKVLVAADGYWYGGKAIDVRDKLIEVAAQLNCLETIVVVPYIAADSTLELNAIPAAVSYADFLAPHVEVTTPPFVRLPFNHPLYILYSSGTTGIPKCILHSAGGTLLQHVKEHRLHADVRSGDRLFYFTTCGWMMWNWLVSGLAAGATLMLYDGNPALREGRILWDYAQEERWTHFGTSAKYIETLSKTAVEPMRDFDLSALRVLMSTGSPLAPAGFQFVYEKIKRDLLLASISGGTDIISCFVLGNPMLPVWPGEIQCVGLGMAVDVLDDDGAPLRESAGELVCTRPFPSMPIGFWNDPTGEKYRAAYFERFANAWCHGDYCEITAHDGLIILGRSDTTLNPGGVRIGTAEIYRLVEKLPEVIESLVIGQSWPIEQPTDVRVVLFVRLADGLTLDEFLIERIKQTIRTNASPRHVPARVVQVRDLPRTRSGKLVELAVRNVVHGLPVKNREALINPEALQEFSSRPELAN